MKRETLFVSHCLHGLEKMYIRSESVFSASYRMIGGKMENVRVADSEYKFTMNTLMGLHKAISAGSRTFIDVEPVYRSLAARIGEQKDSAENIAATVWTGRCIGSAIPTDVELLFDGVVAREGPFANPSAQALAWAITACVHMGERYLERGIDLSEYAIEKYIHPSSALVRHTPFGVRKEWASFAASCYMAYAFLLLAKATKNEEKRKVGVRIARSLVRLQGPQGQWAWFYHVPTGRVADYYPVYSVHQHAMAPFFLLEAMDQGYSEFKEPMVKGFRWPLGQNEFNRSMVDYTHKVIWRSVARREPLGKVLRSVRSIGVAYAGLKSSVESLESLYINTECRSYELGWALWAFAGREDFQDILNDSSFTPDNL